jgi:hypothetical protein
MIEGFQRPGDNCIQAEQFAQFFISSFDFGFLTKILEIHSHED